MSSAKPIKPLLVAPSSTARLMPSTPVDSNPVSIRKTLNASNIVNNRNQMTMVEKPKRKRQRLDHLSQEEKIMRRKLKNRMAAQSARDRKKVKMLDLESVNNGLKAQNEILIKKNACLSQRIKALEKENELLRKNISTNIPSECTITPKKEDLLDMIKLEDVDGEGIIFDVNMSDASYFSELIAGSSCKSPMSSASSDVSDDSGCLLSYGDAASSSSPDCSTMDESFESAEGSRFAYGAATAGEVVSSPVSSSIDGVEISVASKDSLDNIQPFQRPSIKSYESIFEISKDKTVFDGEDQSVSTIDAEIDEFLISIGNTIDQPGVSAKKSEEHRIYFDDFEISESSELSSSFEKLPSMELRSGSPQGVQTRPIPTETFSSIENVIPPNDHDYIRTVVIPSGRDVNNNIDLFDQILSTSNNSQKHPQSPLGNQSPDFGYESLSSPDCSVTAKNVINLFEIEDDYFTSLGILEPSLSDSLLDPTLMELFPEMF